MKCLNSLICRRFTCFVFIISIGLILLNTPLGAADDIPLKNQDNIHADDESIMKNQTKSVEKDLDDFFEDDPGPDSLDKNAGDLDEFFSDGEIQIDSIPDSQTALIDKNYSLNGNINIKTGYRLNHDSPLPGFTDHRGLFDLKGEIDIEFGYKIFSSYDFFVSGSAFYNLAYELNNRNHYTNKFLDDNEKDLELDKLFIRGSLTNAFDIKLGRQVVVWGKSDNIRVTDILNPLDLREPGMTDIEDLRLPVFMTRLDYYFFNLSLSGFLIHEHRSHKMPVFGSSYFYLPNSLPEDTDPSDRIENTEFALSLSATYPGFDISFYMADIYDNSAYLNAKNQRVHGKISMAGVAANKAFGNFLYKAEAALFKGIRLSALQKNFIFVENLHDYSRFDSLVGVEYSGLKDTRLSFEAADKWLIDYDDDAQKGGNREHMVQYALRVSRTFLNEVMEFSILASLYGKTADDGGFLRTQGGYDMSDDISFTLGVIFYKSGSNAMLWQIGENDSIFSSIVYSF